MSDDFRSGSFLRYKLTEALRDDNANEVKEVLQAGKDLPGFDPVTAQDSFGTTLLHIAALHETPKVTGFLLETGVDVNAADANGYTALHVAALNRRSSTVQVLLEKGAAVDASNAKGETPLHLAIERASPNAVKLLLAKGASLEIKNKRGEDATNLSHKCLVRAREQNWELGEALTILNLITDEKERRAQIQALQDELEQEQRHTRTLQKLEKALKQYKKPKNP